MVKAISNVEATGYDMMIIGTTRGGKSLLLQEEAMRLGIPYEELLSRTKPTDQQIADQAAKVAECNQIDEGRLSAVRRAFWESTPADHTDFDCLHDVLCSFGFEGALEPTPNQVRALFMMLPSHILGEVIALGFDDTEVRERIYEFVRQNERGVAESMATLK